MTKAECKKQLKKLGVKYRKLPLAYERHICEGITTLHDQTFRITINERLDEGIQIKVEGNKKSCLISYEAIVSIAEAMGLFDSNDDYPW